ncbi:MAG: iron-sulfur cluster insertion protein ErpA [Oceanospirillaceae bacterium]
MSSPVEHDYAEAMPPAMGFTDSAAKKVSHLMEDEDNQDLRLRVYVTGGGCSGFSYGFTFDDKVAEDDTQIENGEVIMVVDAMSIQYLMGATVDYKESLQGSQFSVTNPNATTTCGCGSSFSI